MHRCRSLTASFLFRAIALGLALACPTTPSWGAVDSSDVSAPANGYPAARELLDEVVGRLPDVPLRVMSELQARSRDGGIERTLNADMQLDWGGAAPSARYTIRDTFGDALEALEIRFGHGGRKTFRYFRGEPGTPAPLPDLYGNIQNTDICWVDLSLSYLWWPGGETVGSEKIKGRFCFIVDLPAPADEEGLYAGVRLWIDPQIHILLQAAGYDRRGEMVKLLEVKSFKKVRDVWVIQDIDVQSFPVRHKTSLRVRKVEGAEPPAEQDSGTEVTK